MQLFGRLPCDAKAAYGMGHTKVMLLRDQDNFVGGDQELNLMR
jgi:hypothetical protein